MKTFERYILNELGDSYRPYAYSLSTIEAIRSKSHGIIHVRAKFKIENGSKYIAELHTSFDATDGVVDVSFHTEAGISTNDRATNEGLATALRVVATVAAATKEHMLWMYKTHGVKLYVSFISGSKTKLGDSDSRKAIQRTKLYMNIINKQFPDARVEDDGPLGISIKPPARFWK